MLYKIAHILRDELSWLWNIIEWINGMIFYIRYGKRMKALTFTTIPDGYTIVPIRDVPTEKMVRFFEHQPEVALSISDLMDSM